MTECSGRSLRLFSSPGLSVLQAFMASRWLHTAQPGPAERSDGFLAQGNGVPVASAEGGHGAEGDVTIGFRVGFDVDWTPKAGRHTVPVGMWS